MEKRLMRLGRRELLLMGVAMLAGCSAPALTVLNEEEVPAKAQGFKRDANTVDRKRFPSFKPGEICATCRLAIAAQAGDYMCSVFPGRSVPAQGWCAAFEVKT
jgi:High potential iron-sulfur protein